MKPTYKCSNDERVTQETIERRYAQSRAEKYQGMTATLMCQAGCGERGNDNDHTISQRRLKDIGKTELIWHPDAYVWNCRNCHRQWENFKSGEWLTHANCSERLLFLKEHDPEGFTIRVTLTQSALQERMEKEIEILRQQQQDDIGLQQTKEASVDRRHSEDHSETSGTCENRRTRTFGDVYKAMARKSTRFQADENDVEQKP